MRQYTSLEQTAKLIELGFEKPKSIEKVTYTEQYGCGFEAAYSIGELLSILPSTVGKYYDLHIEFSVSKWYVSYYWIGNGGEDHIKYQISTCELIDALYNMILTLKEEGVI